MVIDKERQARRWCVNTARSILHAQARSGPFCMVWGRQKPIPLVLALECHHLLSYSESPIASGAGWVVEEARCCSKRRNPPFGENIFFFPNGPRGSWFSWGCRNRSQFSARLPRFGTSQKLCWLPFLSLENTSQWLNVVTRTKVFFVTRCRITWVVQWFTEPGRHGFKLPFCNSLSGCPPVLSTMSLILNLAIC